MDRFFKQIIIGMIYVALFSGVGYGAKRLLVVSPTCFDGVQNQSEEKVDCGPICGNLCAAELLPLKVEYTKLLRATADTYDIVARIENPNIVYGSGNVSYEILFYDPSGAVMSGQTLGGKFYISPNQRRYLVLSAEKLLGNPSRAELAIVDAVWQHIDVGQAPDINFALRRELFTDNGDQGASLEGIILNDSDFDFTLVDIGIILLDAQGEPVAVNSTNVRTLRSKDERYFKVEWPSRVPSDATRVIDAVTNIFANENFIKSYGSEESFQRYR